MIQKMTLWCQGFLGNLILRKVQFYKAKKDFSAEARAKIANIRNLTTIKATSVDKAMVPKELIYA